MKLYRLMIKPQGPFTTPLVSDTFTGQLCWCIKHLFGDRTLAAFIDTYINDEPAFISSCGFARDLLPRPIVPVKGSEADIDRLKGLRKLEYVSQHQLKEILTGAIPSSTATYNRLYIEHDSLHAVISRNTGRTLDTGGLYALSELSIDAPYVSLYALIAEEWVQRVVASVKYMGLTGYGGKKSTGKGQFDLAEISEWAFDETNPNAFMVLSNYVPRVTDPTCGWYRMDIRYGKLGEEYAWDVNPYKRPMLFIAPGSVFLASSPRSYYGRAVRNISTREEVISFGHTVAMPIRCEGDIVHDRCGNTITA
jgi:CRISPR-associated protein Csm4